jgi:regulator of protease activity HflC (stomatin/prohibitin superfamily)
VRTIKNPFGGNPNGSGSLTKPKLSRGCLGCLIFIALFVVGGGWWYSHTVWIPAGYVGVIYNARTGLQNKVYPPQAVYLGFFDQIYTYPTKLQAAIYTQDPHWGEARVADGIQITTSDSASTTFDVTVLYRVDPKDVFTVFSKFGPIPIDDIQTLHIRRAIREGASAIGNQYDVFQLLGPKRDEASQKLTQELQTRLAPKGITIIQAMLMTAYPSNDIAQKINGRVNSYTQLEISKLEAQIADISRQSSVIRGQADTHARTLTAAQTQDKSVEMLKLEMEAQAIDKWGQAGGHLSPIIVRPGQTVIVNGASGPVTLGGRK